MTALALVSYLVADYDEGIALSTGALGFSLAEDAQLGDGKRLAEFADLYGQKRDLIEPVASDRRWGLKSSAGRATYGSLHT